MDQLKIGILGLRRGMTHLRNFLALDQARVIGACDLLENNRQRAAKVIAEAPAKTGEIHDVTFVSDLDALLDLKPDAVVIASHPSMHARHACQILAAGCHVLSEVPGAYTPDEWLEIRAAVEQSGRHYMLAENLSFMDFIRYWRRWFLQGRLGAVSMAETEYLHYLPETLTTPDGQTLTPSQARDQKSGDAVPNWRASLPPIQYLTHDLGPILEILDDRCVSVTCLSAPWRCPETPLRPDGHMALFRTANGILIRVLVSFSTRTPDGHRFRLLGVEGSTEWFSHEGYCRLFDHKRQNAQGWQRFDLGMAAADRDTNTGHGGTDFELARHFTQAVLNGNPMPIDVYRGIEYSLPGMMAARSAESGGQPIEIPDLRRTPFKGTRLWDVVGLPEEDPPAHD
jgi:predicted dehydrogenase